MNTKEKIITSALKNFLVKGYENTTMDIIAKESDIKKSSLYYHFKNKEDLFIKCIEHLLTSIEYYIENSLSTLNYPKDKLQMVFSSIIEFNTNLAYRYNKTYSKPLNCHQMLKIGSSKFIFVRERIDKYYDFLRDIISEIIDEGKKEKLIINDIDTDILTLQFISILEGYLALSEIYSSITSNKILNQLRDSIWSSIAIKENSFKKKEKQSLAKTILGARW
ncbi:MAG: TetR/AcrR family transcriptional regulator [Bacillota bacterium]|nr:TetR/AcrR family transcriptional regulator [Bacillota bacterium]